MNGIEWILGLLTIHTPVASVVGTSGWGVDFYLYLFSLINGRQG